MGALHDGHAALIRRSTDTNDATVVSLFVNPTQFDRGTDFDAYPRTEDDDLDMCAHLGVDAVYMPTVEVMYPDGASTTVDPGPLAAILEGAARPGHFAGVATVVVKLFAACEPDLAYFGEKDLQQLAVVRRIVEDLDLAVTIVGVPTVREPDGLALSSRNRRLLPAHRAAAQCVPRALEAAAELAASGTRDVAVLRTAMHDLLGREPLCRLDYADIVDSTTFTPLTSLEGPASACIAAWFGDVRLIDNMTVSRSR